jgi:Kef-type K+ transport system membrane component KefB
MDYLLATNPVAPLPEGFLSFGQHLAGPVTACPTNKIGVVVFRLKQPTTLGKLIIGLLVGVSSLEWISLAQPVLGLLIPVGVIFLLFGIRLKSNLKILLEASSQAPTMGLQSPLS